MARKKRESKPAGDRASPVKSESIQRMYLPPALPRRPLDGHKGLFGRVLVVGGNESMFGAATLAATAALRTGCGLVQLAVPASVLPFALSVTPELIGLALIGRPDKLFRAAVEAADVIVVGPGMGQTTAAELRLRSLIALRKPMVIDADGLNILAALRKKKWPSKLNHAILTPHPGEMARLCRRTGVKRIPADTHGRVQLAAAVAREFGALILLKGHETVVTDGRRAYVNRTGNSTLSKAGSGDVLSGVIGALLGQGMPLFEAACAAAWLHGKAGELAGHRVGTRSALARDVIVSLAAALAEYPNYAA